MSSANIQSVILREQTNAYRWEVIAATEESNVADL